MNGAELLDKDATVADFAILSVPVKVRGGVGAVGRDNSWNGKAIARARQTDRRKQTCSIPAGTSIVCAAAILSNHIGNGECGRLRQSEKYGEYPELHVSGIGGFTFSGWAWV